MTKDYSMFSLQSIASRIILPVLFVTVIFSLALYYVANSTISGIIEQNLIQNADNKVTEIAVSEKRIATSMLTQAALFSKAQAVQSAYQTAHVGNIRDENDSKMEEARGRLRSYFASIENGYKSVKNGKSFRIHFHLPSIRSLLRLWTTKQNKSDDLSSFRNTVITISKGKHAPIAGIEIGRGGFAIRGIAPVISDKDGYLGSVEVLSSYDPLVRYGISNKQEYIAVYMNKEFLPIAKKLQDQSKNPLIGDKFVYVSATDKSITNALLTPEILSQGAKGTRHLRIDDYFITVFPIKDFSGKQIGVMSYVYDATEAYAALVKLRMGILILCVILVLAILIPLLLGVRSVTTSINRTTQMVKDISEGEGDLTQRLDADRQDELGELASGVNAFIENLQKMLRRMVRGFEGLSREAESLESLAGQQADGADRMAGKANGVATAAEEMNSNMNTVAAAMEQATVNVNTVASGSEEMSATIGEIAKNAETAKEITNQAVAQGQSASERINELGKAADEIGQVTETINAISSQTNLLALNATIEAARAGEAGKGFAVVANEIKDLAQQTAAATGEIAAKIKGIQDSTGATVTEINEIARINKEVDDIVSTISTAVEEQASTTTEIAENIAQASSGLGEVNENIAQTTEVSGSIAQEIAEVNEAAGSMSNASAQVRQSAEELKQLSVELDGLMSRFKL